jgi:hypothetical protein
VLTGTQYQVQARNLALIPQASISFSVTATFPVTCPKTYSWTIAGKQSNNFSGTNNDFTLDTSNSHLTTTVSCVPPADLQVTASHSPASPTAGNQYTSSAVVTNNGPNAESSVRLDITINNGGAFSSSPPQGKSSISGSGWTCPTIDATHPPVGTSATCTMGSLASGATAPTVTVYIDSAASASSVSITYQASGSQPDPSASNNTANDNTTLTPQNNSVAQGTVTSSGGTVTNGATPSNPNGFVMQIVFPANSNVSTFIYTAVEDAVPANFCGGLPCTLSAVLDTIPASYTVVYYTIVCGPTLCPPGNVTGTSWKNGAAVPQFPVCTSSSQVSCVDSSLTHRDSAGNWYRTLRLPGGDPAVGDKCYAGCSPAV